MGIQGLLPLLKSIQKHTQLKEFAGQTLGVDAYGWLHRGTVACAIELAEGRPTRKHIDFALHRVRMLIHFGVRPYMVFDGDYLPSKAHTESLRAAKRRESKKTGLELMRMGRLSQAYGELQKAIDVTPLMARELIEELKRLDVPYVVAPYEADSQLAYLEKQGLISGVISEDSDLLVFGVKRLLTKLDQYGECILINRADFTACRDISLVGWTDKEFRMMAMLSGCDYLPGLEKMGLKTAYRLVRKYKAVERVVQTVQFDGKVKVPAGYLDAFVKAERTFLYQWVFCPTRRGLVNLSELPSDLTAAEMPYIGKHVDSAIAAGVASGTLDPHSKEPLVLPKTFVPSSTRSKVVDTPLGKSGKPISEFFKAKRTPLAELDPNSLTPSPSQQRLLQTAGNVSWSASRITNVDSAAAGSVLRTSTTSQVPRRAASDPRPNAREMFPKRQRLCDESSIAAAMDGSEGLQAASSRFFVRSTTETTPIQRKKSTAKSYDFELWSDDSAAEALAAAAASSEKEKDVTIAATPKRTKRFTPYIDRPTRNEDATEGDSIDQNATTRSKLNSPEHAVEHDLGPLSKISRPLFKRNAGSMVSFEPGPSPKIPQSLARTQFASATAKNNDLETSNFKELGKFIHPDQPKTKGIDIAPSRQPSKQYTAMEKESDEPAVDDNEWLEMEQRPANLYGPTLYKGSEDLLVPNSPESDAEHDESTQPKLHLGRFAYTDNV